MTKYIIALLLIATLASAQDGVFGPIQQTFGRRAVVQSGSAPWVEPHADKLAFQYLFKEDTNVLGQIVDSVEKNPAYNASGASAATWMAPSNQMAPTYLFTGGDYVYAPNASGFVISTGQPFAVSMWVCHNDYYGSGAAEYLFSYYVSGYGGIRVFGGSDRWSKLGGGFQIYGANDSAISVSPDHCYREFPAYTGYTLPAGFGEWSHILVQYTADLSDPVKYYINGLPEGVKTNVNSITANITAPIPTNIYIGAYYTYNPSYDLRGELSDVRLYTNCLFIDAEVADTYRHNATNHNGDALDILHPYLWSNTVLILNFDDTRPNMAYDNSSAGFQLKASQNVNTLAAGSHNGTNGIYVFDSVVGFFKGGYLSGWEPEQTFCDGTNDFAFSVEVWANPISEKNAYPLIFQSAKQFRVYAVGGFGGGQNQRIIELHLIDQGDTGKGILASNTVKLPTNAWTHIVYTYDGSKSGDGIKLWTNGVQATIGLTTNTSYTGMLKTVYPETTSACGSLYEVPSFKMDMLRVYKAQVLTETDVNIRYNGTKGRLGL